MRRNIRWLGARACALGLLLSGCGLKSGDGAQAAVPLTSLRADAAPEQAGQWLLSELLAPGGDPKHAATARKALEGASSKGMLESLARALDDTVHGRLATAPDHFLEVAKAARTSDDPDAEMIAWFATEHAVALQGNTRGLFERWKPWVEESIAQPKGLGWRARDQLVAWWAREAYSAAKKDVEQAAVAMNGCLQAVRLSGPFGVGAAADAQRTFAAEQPGAWPQAWPRDEWSGNTPRIVATARRGCAVAAKEATRPGVFYAEAGFELASPAQAVVLAANALQVWIDGVLVFERDVRTWAAWTHASAGVSLAAGPHRIVAKLSSSDTSLRLLQADGTPLPFRGLDAAPLATPFPRPAVTFEADTLRRYVQDGGVTVPGKPWLAYVAALLANLEHESEAATLLIESLIRDPKLATGPALAAAAAFARQDPIYPPSQTEDLVRDLHERALARDPALWESQLAHVTFTAKNRSLMEGLRELKKLTAQYPQVPALLAALASTYGDLGWTAEYSATVKLRAERFPEDTEGLMAAAEVAEQEGKRGEAQKLYERVRELDPDTDLFVTRALARRDFDAALTELDRLLARRPQNQVLRRRQVELKKLAGQPVDVLESLKRAVSDSPLDGKLRLALADAEYARGNPESLELALADAIKDGAAPGPLNSAIDLLEGMTELERFRLDSRSIIEEFEKSGKQLPGTAARVLDYLAVWVHTDGSSRMLEHEIVKIQSEEAISKFAEQEFGDELVLKARVIKADGRTLEPEVVREKPTVTFPHIQVGDYVETERVIFKRADAGGMLYDGPHWFFREKDVPYARSEFLIVIPRDRKLDITTFGGAPAPEVRDEGYFRAYRFRVDDSPAAPSEPMSVPPQEYLPSVSVNWGMTLERRLRMLANNVADLSPVDPRIGRIAANILKDVRGTELDKARALYRFTLSEIEEGEESDGRRAIIGRNGNRWRAYAMLCRASGIPVRWAVVRSRLAPEPHGSAQEAAQYAQTVLRVGSGPYAWVDLNDKYTPFGYLAAAVRGMPGYLLGLNGAEATVMPNEGQHDELAFSGDFDIDERGGARAVVEQSFGGRYGAVTRKGLSEIQESRLRDVIEGRILSSNLRGARLVDYELVNQGELDRPLLLKMSAEVPRLAVRQGQELRIEPPFAPRLGQYATLSQRQTPILLPSDQDLSVSLRLHLPAGAQVKAPEQKVISHRNYVVTVRDRMEGQDLILERTIRLPAGRIPVAEYPDFIRFVQAADAALNQDIVVVLR